METSKENVLVAGANGTTGKLIVSYLRESQYYNPVAMVRKQEQQKQFKIQEVDTVLGDLEKDLSRAVKGIDKVIFAAGSGAHTGPDKTIDVDWGNNFPIVSKKDENLPFLKYQKLLPKYQSLPDL